MGDHSQKGGTDTASVTSRLAQFETELARQNHLLGKLAARLGAIEDRPHTGRIVEGVFDDEVRPSSRSTSRSEPARWFARAGRTFLILGGAFLLRGLTSAGHLPDLAGIGLGITYAMIWLIVADRTATAGLRPRAVQYAVASLLVAFPLAIEATTRFAALSPWGSALVVLATTIVALVVAVRHDLHVLGWLATVGGGAAGLAIAPATRALLPAAMAVHAVCLLSIALARTRGWTRPRWLLAVAADLFLPGLVFLVIADRSTQSPAATIAVLLGIVITQLGAFAWFGRIADRIGAFEIIQGIALLALAFVGALRIALAHDVAVAAIAATGSIMAISLFALAFVLERRGRHLLEVHYFAGLATLLLLIGLPWVIGSAATWVFLCIAFVAVLAGLSGSRGNPWCAEIAILLWAGAANSNLLAVASQSFVRSAQQSWSPWSATTIAVGISAGVAYLATCRRETASRRRVERLGQIALLALLFVAVGGALIAVLVPPLAGAPGPASDAAAIAALRTLVLTGAAVALSALRRRGVIEAGWLAFCLLGVTGIKLLAEDLPNGRPATLFVALAAYGLAFLAASRMIERTADPAGDAGSGAPTEPV